VDAVQRILAIAERERRKRAQKKESNEPPPRTVAPDTAQNLHQSSLRILGRIKQSELCKDKSEARLG
jgi:hypothetical protein